MVTLKKQVFTTHHKALTRHFRSPGVLLCFLKGIAKQLQLSDFGQITYPLRASFLDHKTGALITLVQGFSHLVLLSRQTFFSPLKSDIESPYIKRSKKAAGYKVGVEGQRPTRAPGCPSNLSTSTCWQLQRNFRKPEVLLSTPTK